MLPTAPKGADERGRDGGWLPGAQSRKARAARACAMDLHEFRAERTRKTQNLLKEDHRDLKRFFALDSAAYRDGALPGNVKELLGLVASTVLRCNDCIAYHADQCVQAGWSKAEVLDALNVALVVGGSITIPHLRTVWEVVDQLYAEQEAGAAGQGASGASRASGATGPSASAAPGHAHGGKSAGTAKANGTRKVAGRRRA